MLEKRSIRKLRNRHEEYVLTRQGQGPIGDRILWQVHIVDLPSIQTRVQRAHGKGSSGLKCPGLGDVAETSNLEGHYRLVPCTRRSECLPKGLSTRGGNGLPCKAHQARDWGFEEATGNGIAESCGRDLPQGRFLEAEKGDLPKTWFCTENPANWTTSLTKKP